MTKRESPPTGTRHLVTIWTGIFAGIDDARKPRQPDRSDRRIPAGLAGSTVGNRFGVYFGDADTPAAVIEMQSDAPDEVVWRVLEGPDTRIDTVITFAMYPSGNGGTTLLFTHARWAEASEFMTGSSTNWGAYLTSLKTGAEGVEFRPYPQGEICRWG